MTHRMPPEQRFLRFIDPNPGPIVQPGMGPCRIWIGGHFTSGRACFGHDNAARAAWLLFVGPIAPGLQVCHRCDNVNCVDWDNHLFLGTHLDNMRDMIAKGRERHPFVTECKYGHAYDEENTIIRRNGAQKCRECTRIGDRARYWQRKADAVDPNSR
jgi:hypothetical protein